MMELKFQRLAYNDDLPLPAYETPGAAGLDIRATHPGHVAPRSFTVVKTGFCVEVPRGYELQVRPRSGLAAKYGITVLNSPGTIDSDYRGEVLVLLQNTHSESPFFFGRGDRIAQLVLARVSQATVLEVESLSSTDRGKAGLGSTGL